MRSSRKLEVSAYEKQEVDTQEPEVSSHKSDQIKSNTLPIGLKHLFISVIGDKKNCKETLLSKNEINWFDWFSNAIKPYAQLKFLEVNIDPYSYNNIWFNLAIEHNKPLNIDHFLRDGISLERSFLETHTKNVNFTVVFNDDAHYLSKDASVLCVSIYNLDANEQNELDEKLKNRFEQIKLGIQEIFTQGVSFNENVPFPCESWLVKKDSFFNERVNLSKITGTEYEYDKTYFLNTENHLRNFYK